MYLVYSVVLTAALLAAAPWFAWRGVRYRKYIGNLRQRLGHLPLSLNLDRDPSIWVHAVSVGEVLAIRPLVPALKERFPRLRLFVSTTTVTGQDVARKSLAGADAVFYFPFDLGWIVRRVVDVVNPRLFVMVENEIWPNVLRECRRRGVKVAIVNGRISARSFPRYRLARAFFRRVLADVDRLCMQGEESARRVIAIGADPARVLVTGSLKFDAAALPVASIRGRERVLRFFRVGRERAVLVAGSTMRGEEAPVLRAFRRVKVTAPQALLVLAPRHAERFDEVVQVVRGEGFSVVRRSELAIDAEPRADVVVLDTIGELAQVYQIATVAFVGGSLVPTGGHNILEPAVFGRPILFGPHMSNFAEIAREFLARDAAVQVASPRALEDALPQLLLDPVRRASLGAAASALVEANRGANDRTLETLAALLPGRPATIHPFRVVH
jgi:3-deoxy-D-manno-octulosonic-acid transferase